MIQTKNKIIINIISKRSKIIGFTPKTLKEEDKKYIKRIKLKLWKDLMKSLFEKNKKTMKGIDKKIKKKNVIFSLV